MTEEFTLSIVKIEGLGDLSSSECILLLDNIQISRNSLSSLPITLKIPGDSFISLNISETSSNTKIAGLSFQSPLLPHDWFYWLPLFLSSENFIEQLPINIGLPRILLAVNKQIFPDSSITLKDSSSKTNSKQDTKDPNNVLPTELLEHYQQMIQDLQLELKQVRETSKQKCEYLKKKVQNFKQNLKLEKKFRIDLEAKLEKTLKIIENKEFFLEFLKSYSNKSPKTQKTLENEIFSWKDSSKTFENCFNNLNLSSKTPESHKIETCDHIQIIPDFFTLEDRPLTTFFDETCKGESDIDSRVKSILSRLKFEGLLQRRRELNYKIGAKTITLCLKNNEVHLKSGLPLEKYLFSSCKSEIEDYLRSRSSPKKTTRSPLGSSRCLRPNTQRFD
jgi:molybdopterin converting factor small subunit